MPHLLDGIDAVLFDAGFTLLEPVRSVAEVYYEKALSYTDDLDRPHFDDRLKRLWVTLRNEYRSRSPDLVSSEELERAAWHDFTEELAKPYPALASRHREWLTELVEYFDHPRAWQPMAGATELLTAFRQRGVRVGIVSNWHSALHDILKGHDFLPHCEFVTVSSEVGRKKPHPEIFDHAVRRLAIAPKRIAHVGDSWEEDVEGAAAFGLRAIFFSPNAACPEARPSVPVITSLRELLDS